MSIFADILMVMHLLWALFMILGLPLGLWLRSPTIRWVHFGGMMATAFFAVSGMYCPLTIWEEILRWEADPGFTYGGSFLARYLSPILYPQIESWMIRSASVVWGFLTIGSMVLKRPGAPFQRRDRS